MNNCKQAGGLEFSYFNILKGKFAYNVFLSSRKNCCQATQKAKMNFQEKIFLCAFHIVKNLILLCDSFQWAIPLIYKFSGLQYTSRVSKWSNHKKCLGGSHISHATIDFKGEPQFLAVQSPSLLEENSKILFCEQFGEQDLKAITFHEIHSRIVVFLVWYKEASYIFT